MKKSQLKFVCFGLLFGIISSCNDGSEQISILTAESMELNQKYEQQMLETRQAVQRADSLQTLIHDLESEVQTLRGEVPVYNASEADEQAIEALVHSLHQGWAKMFKTDDTKDLLQHFMPKYTAGAIRINAENIPSVRRKNNSNFEEFLHQLVNANQISISFGETKFMYTEVKGDIFVTTYRTKMRVYEANQQSHTSSLVTQLSGERVGDEWKVGDYHWVSFNY